MTSDGAGGELAGGEDPTDVGKTAELGGDEAGGVPGTNDEITNVPVRGRELPGTAGGEEAGGLDAGGDDAGGEDIGGLVGGLLAGGDEAGGPPGFEDTGHIVVDTAMSDVTT